MGLGRALPLMIDIAHGVAEVHAARIVICDLKPQNVSQAFSLLSEMLLDVSCVNLIPWEDLSEQAKAISIQHETRLSGIPR